MTTVTLSVLSREALTQTALGAFDGEAQDARISFASPELLWKTLTQKRWELLQAIVWNPKKQFLDFDLVTY